jgi:hypothetical protein
LAERAEVVEAMTRLEELQTDLQKLMATQEYAFAMGHGCSIGHHPTYAAIRDRAAELRTQIAVEKFLDTFGPTDRDRGHR